MSLNRISTKLAIVGLSFILPIATMLSLMIAAKQEDIEFSLQETRGNTYQKPLELVMEELSRHRIAVVRAQAGDTEAAARLSQIRLTLESHLQDLRAVDDRIGVDLQFTAEGLGKRKRESFTAERLTKDLQEFVAQDLQALSVKEYGRFFAHIRTMITHAGDTSNLILDPDLDSYYLMDVSLLALPQVQERLQEIAIFVEEIHARGTITESDRIQASTISSDEGRGTTIHLRIPKFRSPYRKAG